MGKVGEFKLKPEVKEGIKNILEYQVKTHSPKIDVLIDSPIVEIALLFFVKELELSAEKVFSKDKKLLSFSLKGADYERLLFRFGIMEKTEVTNQEFLHEEVKHG